MHLFLFNNVFLLLAVLTKSINICWLNSAVFLSIFCQWDNLKYICAEFLLILLHTLVLLPVEETKRSEDRQQTTSEEVKDIVHKYNSSKNDHHNAYKGTDNSHGMVLRSWFLLFTHFEYFSIKFVCLNKFSANHEPFWQNLKCKSCLLFPAAETKQEELQKPEEILENQPEFGPLTNNETSTKNVTQVAYGMYALSFFKFLISSFFGGYNVLTFFNLVTFHVTT